MSFLLDTNICSAAMKSDRRLYARFVQYAGNLFTSRIVLAEIYAWICGSHDSQKRRESLEDLLNEVDVLEFDDACAERFGGAKSLLGSLGITVPPIDLLIASTALVHGATMVT